MNSEEFKKTRLELGLSQGELGLIMGMVQQAVGRIETGERQPTKIQASFLRFLFEAKKQCPDFFERFLSDSR